MAWHVCETCSKDFERTIKGRPPRQCPECIAEGIKPPAKGRIARPVPSYGSTLPTRATPVAVDVLPGEVDQGDEPNPYVGTDMRDAVTIDHDKGDPGSMLEEAIRQIAQQSVSRVEITDMINDAMSGMDMTINTKLDNADKALADKVAGIVATIGSRTIEITRLDKSAVTIESAHSLLPDVIQTLTAEEHVFLVGPAGSGKSTMAEHAAMAMGVPFASMSVGPMTSNTKLFGYMDAAGNYVTTEFRKVYEGGGIFLLDEMDNGHPGLLTEMNQALSNGYCAFGDQMVKRHETFRCISSGNTFGTGASREYVGRNKLDEATLDRFTVIECPVDEMLERKLAMQYATPENRVSEWIDYVQRIRHNVDSRKLSIIVSPRATIGGARLLNVGMAWHKVADRRLWKSVKPEDRRSIDV